MKILKCLLMVVTAPVILALTLLVWLCTGLIYNIRDLAAGKGAEFEICDPGLDVWVNDVNIIWNEKKQDNGR